MLGKANGNQAEAISRLNLGVKDAEIGFWLRTKFKPSLESKFSVQGSQCLRASSQSLAARGKEIQISSGETGGD